MSAVGYLLYADHDLNRYHSALKALVLLVAMKAEGGKQEYPYKGEQARTKEPHNEDGSKKRNKSWKTRPDERGKG